MSEVGTMGLQTYDGVVKSVLEVRGIRNDLSDMEFALWYEDRYKITYMRVLGILRASSQLCE